MPDPRWLEILKASGWQMAAVAVAAFLFLWADRAGWLPPLDPWMIQGAAATMTLCGLLALASAASNSVEQVKKWCAIYTERSQLRHSIETLNADETAFLKDQVNKDEATTQLNPFSAGRSIPQFVHQTGLYQGLQSKNILDVTAADQEGRIQTITIKKAAWKKLKKKFKKNDS